METRQESQDRYIAILEKHLDSTKESVRYSSDRFDILIISLSTSALVLSIGFLKDIIKNFSSIDIICLKTSWFLFVVALLSNLISQVSGYFANRYEIKVTTSLIAQERGNSPDADFSKNEKLCKRLNYITQYLNLVSLLSFIFGVIFLVRFITINI
jgi:hypothetical protein